MGFPGYAGWTVQLDPPAVATNRVMLDLNSGPIQIGGSGGGKGPDWGQAQITAYMADQQRWGSAPVDYRVPNRTVTIPLMLGADTSGGEQTARTELAQKVARIQDEGGWLLRQRAGGPAMYADIVNASLTIPDVWGETGGVEPDVVLTLECLPDFYGDEITLDTIHATGVCSTVLEQSGVPAAIAGDYPARCRITDTDLAGQQQFTVLWGARSRHYDSAAAAALVLEAEALTPAAGASVQTLAGASGGSVVQLTGVGAGSWADLLTLALPASSGAAHVGSYRLWARVRGTSAIGTQYRLLWRTGPGPVTTNDAVSVPGLSNYYLIDLGPITVVPNPVTGARWFGFVQTIGDAGGAAANIDVVYLQPLDESAGRIVNPFPTDSIGADQAVEIDSEGAFQQGGAYWGPATGVYGDLPRLPPSGLEGRPCEIFIHNSRSDLAGRADAGLDPFTVVVKYRPCWLSRP